MQMTLVLCYVLILVICKPYVIDTSDKLFFDGHKMRYDHTPKSMNSYSNLLSLHNENNEKFEELDYSKYVNRFKYDIEFHNFHPMVNLDSSQIEMISISCDTKLKTKIYIENFSDIMAIWNKVNDYEWLISSKNKTKWKLNCKNMKRNKVNILYMMDECKLHCNKYHTDTTDCYIQCDNTRKATYSDLFENLDLHLQTNDINIHHNDEFKHNIHHYSDKRRLATSTSTTNTLYKFLSNNWNPSTLAANLNSNFGFNSTGNNKDPSVSSGVIDVTQPLFQFGVKYEKDIIENLMSLTGQFSLKSALLIRIKIQNNKLVSYFAGIQPTSTIEITLGFEYEKEITKDQSLGKYAKTFGLNVGIFKVGIDIGLEIIAGIKTVIQGSFSCSYLFTLKGEMGLTFKDFNDNQDSPKNYVPTQSYSSSNTIQCTELTASLNIQTYLYPALYCSIDYFFGDQELLRLSFKPYLEFNAEFSTASHDCYFDIQFNRGLQLVLSSEIANKEWSLYSNKWPIWTGCLDDIFPSLLSKYKNPDSSTKLKLPNNGLQSGSTKCNPSRKISISASANQITGPAGTSWHGQFFNPTTSSAVLGFTAYEEEYHTFQVVNTDNSESSAQFITSTILDILNDAGTSNGTCLILLDITFERNTDQDNDYLFDVIYDNEPSPDLCQLATVDYYLFETIKTWLDQFFFSTPAAFYFDELDSFIFYSNSAIQLLRTEPFAELNDLQPQFFQRQQIWIGSMKSLQWASTFPVARSVVIYYYDDHGELIINGDVSYSFTVKITGLENVTSLYFDCDGKQQIWMLGSLAITESGDAFYYGASIPPWSTYSNCQMIQGTFVLKLVNGTIPINTTTLETFINVSLSMNTSLSSCVYINPTDNDIGSDDDSSHSKSVIGYIVGSVISLVISFGCCYFCKKKCCKTKSAKTDFDDKYYKL